ncbi:DUF2252 domain-containing protein [Catenulispora sp. NF23]|uniref:DUF2252 domain-containing protein n=2 Tax=Catenulispora pinistramenti TaxID=2705254 RepID=A0ABS5L4G9_9ACTN|nr:DUF2252 domain-containing protein [Catenulispora pinistramenti]MBS2553250.1 DUF2252 domain-containing protein [Catenulispora pinistramenti]
MRAARPDRTLERMTNSSPASRVAAGRAARKRVTRSSTGDWAPAPDRSDPMAILEKQGATRIPGLVPIRYGRMAATEFAFLRGAPAIMAADLAQSPDTGLIVQLCGDAHLSNFGLYASPERRLVFDLNDFDETLPGPFEWDVKRLTASIAVAARQNGFSDDFGADAAREAARAYRTMMTRLAGLNELDVWYQSVDATMLLQLSKRKRGRREVEATLKAAEQRTNLQALKKLTGPGPDGTPRIRYQPPLLVPFAELGFDRDTEEETIRRVFTDYRSTLQGDRRALLDRFRYVESAMKVVGVGSVGTRCSMSLLLGETTSAPLFLQVKEAQESVLAPYQRASRYEHQGHRVVAGQRLMQATSDIFLGWASGPEGRYSYIRQLRDMKGSANVPEMDKALLRAYADLCGHTLARAHARSGDRVAISAYLGGGDSFDRAMGQWAVAYADQTREDRKALLEAIKTGRVRAVSA